MKWEKKQLNRQKELKDLISLDKSDSSMNIEKYVPRYKLNKFSNKVTDKQLELILKMATFVGNMLGASTT